jgi:putative N6-adenine-specific DNA methylase
MELHGELLPEKGFKYVTVWTTVWMAVRRLSNYELMMTAATDFEIFIVSIPGLESVLLAEIKSKGFATAKLAAGGVTIVGGWHDVWRANLELRGASRILARIGEFRVSHLAQLDKRARAFPWKQYLKQDVPLRIETSCKKSRIYHSGAATQRIATAIAEELGASIDDAADLIIKARIDNDLCTISIDTSGEMLHKRGHKQSTAKAPMRETMASLFLRECSFAGNEPVLDPMCGSGTFVIEAAEMAAGLMPGRDREFAFEKLVSFNAKAWNVLRTKHQIAKPAFNFYGSDRDAGAISSSRANATRAGVSDITVFEQKSMSDIAPPEGPPGLVIFNPPYGTRIGDKKPLHALYNVAGKILQARFAGWRVGVITSDPSLAKSTGLHFKQKSPPVLHGGLKVYLFQTNILE